MGPEIDLARLAALNFSWLLWARPEQLPPPEPWTYWLVLAGRGAGKTRLSAEWVRSIKDRVPRIALVAETAADARDVMVEGESGILACSPPWDRPVYEPSKRRLTWANGAQATTYSAEEPDTLRGPNHGAAWCDELAKYRYPDDVWDMLNFGLRLGTAPQCVITTTPRPIPLLRSLINDPDVVVTRGSTFDNRANLTPMFFEKVVKRYEGTRLGRQELEAELLEDTPGALWTRAMLDQVRATEAQCRQIRASVGLSRIVVGVDPSGTAGDEGSAQGIVTVGAGRDGKYYVLEDVSCSLSPENWAREVIGQFDHYRADRIVCERNFGGDMCAAVIRTARRNAPVRMVTASRGKSVRAEPVAALYEQGRVVHLGAFPDLEDQMCAMTSTGFSGAGSPDRVDALVWALSDLAFPSTQGTATTHPAAW